MESGKQKKKRKKGRWPLWVKAVTSRRSSQVAKDISTPDIPISAHQCMITPKAAPIEEKSASSAGDLEEDVQGDTGSMEVEMRNESGVEDGGVG